MKGISIILVFTIAASGASSHKDAQPRRVCWPLHFAGLTVGLSNDSHMRRLLGDGVFRKNEGDTGGRIIIDSARTSTLHAQFYTDRTIGELTLSRGVEPGLTKSEQEQAASKYFNPREGFGNWHALHLGSNKDAVLANLGPPESGGTTDEWTYFTACVCELDEYFTITFVNGHISKVLFAAPSG